MRLGTALLSILLLAAAPVAAQSFFAPGPNAGAMDLDLARHAPDLSLAVAAPHMAAELALHTYEQHAQHQAEALAGYTASTLVQAELPDTAQRGEFELRRQYSAPDTLQFKPVRFTGDGFVKSNVILRVLQSEVDHVQKRQGALTAISSANYKFNYKGLEYYEGQPLHVYAVKPREKRPGLFKGRIYLDAYTGSLRRAEGSLVKSPSFFIKKIEFVQEYADFLGFTLPVHIHSVAKTRLVGRAVVDIVTRDYSPSVQSASLLRP